VPEIAPSPDIICFGWKGKRMRMKRGQTYWELGLTSWAFGCWCWQLWAVAKTKSQEQMTRAARNLAMFSRGRGGGWILAMMFWGWNNGANYRVLSIFVVSLASAGWIWFRIFSLLGTSRQFFYNRLCLVFPFPLFAYVCCVFFFSVCFVN